MTEQELAKLREMIFYAASVKRVTMPAEVYDADIRDAQFTGQRLVMAAVRDIVATGGQNTEVPESATSEMREFIQFVKDHVK